MHFLACVLTSEVSFTYQNQLLVYKIVKNASISNVFVNIKLAATGQQQPI